jgi:hypothetical protein
LGVDGPETELVDGGAGVGIAAHEHELEHEHVRLARSLMRRYNGHHRGHWYDSSHLPKGRQRRWASYNGCISQQQLKWLDNILNKSLQHQQIVIIFVHVPIAASMSVDAVIWNYPQIIRRLKRAPNVVACFQGHVHEGDYHFVAPPPPHAHDKHHHVSHPHKHHDEHKQQSAPGQEIDHQADSKGEGKNSDYHNDVKQPPPPPPQQLLDDEHEHEHEEADGIHFVTLHAILTCANGNDAYSIGWIYHNRIELIGYGKQTSRTLFFTQRTLQSIDAVS